ncbi:hypothetical protein KCU61_g464, partial [Aureobasidium melanogenum]
MHGCFVDPSVSLWILSRASLLSTAGFITQRRYTPSGTIYSPPIHHCLPRNSCQNLSPISVVKSELLDKSLRSRFRDIAFRDRASKGDIASICSFDNLQSFPPLSQTCSTNPYCTSLNDLALAIQILPLLAQNGKVLPRTYVVGEERLCIRSSHYSRALIV